MKRLLAVVVVLAAFGVSGCSTGVGSTTSAQGGSSDHAAATPTPTFADSYGGNGGAWKFPAACPAPAKVAALIGSSALTSPAGEASGTLLNNGCHYGNTALAQGVEFFEDHQSYAGVTPEGDTIQVALTPSLGEGAQVVIDGSWKLCSAEVPVVAGDQFTSIVVTVFFHGKTDQERCDYAVKVLREFVKQS